MFRNWTILSPRGYGHWDLFRDVPDLEKKKLLDVGAGTHMVYTEWGYKIALIDRFVDGGMNDDDAYDKATSYVKENTTTLDEQYGGWNEFERQHVHSKLVVGDARDIKLPKESFDIVTVGWLFDLYKEKPDELQKIVDGCGGVLKPNGLFIGDVPMHPIKSNMCGSAVRGVLPYVIWFRNQVKQYTELIETHGLEIVESGLGFIKNRKPHHTTFYFISQKK